MLAALLVVTLAAPAEVPPVEGPVTVAPDAPTAAETTTPATPPDVDELPPARPRRAPPDIDTLPPPSSGLIELLGPLFKTMLMLAVVVGIAYLTLHKGLGKLVARQNLGRRIKVVERVSLDPKRTLFLVELDGKQMLLGAGEGGVVHLKDLGATTPTAPTEPATFAAALEAKRSEST
ncbi:MAG: FliO/MopB family protein [Deltaproteobacteria bacterium]|nr:FliO/MopB family protein [Deltaproteobacteria bacterium]